MPLWINKNHWCLIIADLNLKKYRYFDPSDLSTASHMKDKFLLFLKKRNSYTSGQIDVKQWNVESKLKYPAQKDDVNCGIYVIYYGLCAMKLLKIQKIFDPAKFRNKLVTALLERSPTMRHLCVKCDLSEYEVRGTEEVIGQMVQWSKCHRWLHKRCSPELRDLSLDNIQKTNYLFNCLLCQRAITLKTHRGDHWFVLYFYRVRKKVKVFHCIYKQRAHIPVRNYCAWCDISVQISCLFDLSDFDFSVALFYLILIHNIF